MEHVVRRAQGRTAFVTAGRLYYRLAKPVLRSVEEIDRLERPDALTNGLLPFVIKRLQHVQHSVHLGEYP